MLSLTWSLKRITTKFEFKIARSAESYYDVVILELSDGTPRPMGKRRPPNAMSRDRRLFWNC